MRKLQCALATAAVLGLSAGAVQAAGVSEGETYAGGGIAAFEFSADGIPDTDPMAAIGRLGYGVADNFAIEGRLGLGIKDDEIGSSGDDLEIDEMVGAYVVGHIPVDPDVSLYGLAGFTHGSADIDLGNNVSISDDDESVSLGVGVEADITDRVSGYVEWVDYIDGSDYDVTALSAGALVNF